MCPETCEQLIDGFQQSDFFPKNEMHGGPLNKITFQKCYNNVTLWQCDVCRYISETSMKHIGNPECPTSFTLHMGWYICDVPETFREPRCGVRETFQCTLQKCLSNIPTTINFLFSIIFHMKHLICDIFETYRKYYWNVFINVLFERFINTQLTLNILGIFIKCSSSSKVTFQNFSNIFQNI